MGGIVGQRREVRREPGLAAGRGKNTIELERHFEAGESAKAV
jgi:hypothetical protein